ncbi:ligase [Photobacterium damselae subsp. damselae]|uniref:PglL family O-oligosaccharyltransferase n=1 Tax=Photobacterium damselae TaxID=38293 RepID=UPI00220361D9|nr:PglL family O-oligosaccharyltransferase [Photobacterium damselae]BDR33221.1 ligase [Photobacterium damselae subsp. damselae]
MAVVQLQGTRLEPQQISKPLVRYFLVSIATLFLLAMHYFQHNPGGSGLELSFNVTSWIPFSIAIALGLAEICRQKIWRYSKLTLILLLCCVLLSLPVFYPNADASQVSFRLFTLWSGWLFFVALQQFTFTHKQRQRILWFILAGILIETLFAWVQFLYLKPGNPFGYDTLANRPYGIFQQPNVMASFLATGLVLSAYLLARVPMYRGKWNWQHLILQLTPVLIIPILVVLSSRTGWLGAIVGVGLMIPYLRRFAPKKLWIGWLLMVAAGLMSAWGLTAERSWAPADGRVSLQSLRSVHIPQAFDMFKAEPMTGYGYGRFETAYITQTAIWHHDDPKLPTGVPSLDHPHNELVFWAAEGGIIPLLGLLIAAAAVFLKIKKARQGTQLALIGLFFPITLHTQLEYPFYHSLIHWIVFIIFIYWVDNLTAKYYRYQATYVLTLKVFSIALPIVITSFMITTLYSGAQLTKFETSKPINVDYLMKVNNPWAWQNRFEWDLHVTQLQIGVATEKPQLIEDYINWATIKAQTWPRPALYQNLILAYNQLNNHKQAEQIEQEAQFLFPKMSFSHSQAVTTQAKPQLSQAK